MKRVLLGLSALAMLPGCEALGIGGNNRGPRTPTVGERTPVLSQEQAIAADPAIADVPVTVPGPIVNTEWAQSGGSASKSIGHVALPDTIAQAWSVSIGEGSSQRARLVAEPVVADGKVFTIDTTATVRAFDAATGAVLWATPARGTTVIQRGALFGGGVAYDSGRLYATNGNGYAFAIDPTNGAILWQVRPAGPLRGAPTIGGDSVYVLTQDNQIFALNTANGERQWTSSGSFELANVFGVASPAFSQSTVVAGFSSGELTAYRYENGQVVWQDALARTAVSTVVGTLSDIDADPVVDNGRVFSIGQGGRMVAVELITGQRVWELNIAGISTPWVAGEWVYVVTDEAQLLAVARSTGRIRWMSQLPRYRDPGDRQGPIYWRGPVLAGNRLVLTSSTGQIAFVNPVDGSVLSTVAGSGAFSLPPVVANNVLYTLDNNGRLSAWR